MYVACRSNTCIEIPPRKVIHQINDGCVWEGRGGCETEQKNKGDLNVFYIPLSCLC